jgi:hypothetical protein
MAASQYLPDFLLFSSAGGGGRGREGGGGGKENNFIPNLGPTMPV